MTQELPTRAEAKLAARRLREDLAAEGVQIGHSQALEKIAHSLGFHDWNALHAAIKDVPERGWNVGQRVTGSYLSQRFAATILQAETLESDQVRLVLDLDKPVDVIRFEGMSNLRKRIRAVVGQNGRSFEQTSDGVPHLQIDLAQQPNSAPRKHYQGATT